MSNVEVHKADCSCGMTTAGQVLAYDGTFAAELAYAEAEVIAAINAERLMAEVVGR